MVRAPGVWRFAVGGWASEAASGRLSGAWSRRPPPEVTRLPQSTKPAPAAAFAVPLLAAHRGAVDQDRPGQRLTVERHTVTRVLAALGLVAADWSAWYRLLGNPRCDDDVLVLNPRDFQPGACHARPGRITTDLKPYDRTMPRHPDANEAGNDSRRNSITPAADRAAGSAAARRD